MSDAMLTELYKRVFETKREAEVMDDGDVADRRRMVAIAKNKLLAELIDFRTDLLISGRE